MAPEHVREIHFVPKRFKYSTEYFGEMILVIIWELFHLLSPIPNVSECPLQLGS